MSFQTSQDDLSFGPSGERILPSSIKGQIFEFNKTIYILYTELINNQYSIIIYNSDTQQKSILHTSNEKIVIRTLQFDTINRKVWFGGYLDAPMRGFISSTTLNTPVSVISSLSLIPNTRTIETITMINVTTIIYSALSNLNECWIMSNNSIHNKYKINTTLSGITIKDTYLRPQGNTKFYYIFIDGVSSSTNRSQVELYKIPLNTLIGSL
jgi:hypothetical protein